MSSTRVFSRTVSFAAALLCAVTLVSSLACGRYGPPRWPGGKPIPTASKVVVQPESDEVSLAPNPEMQEQIGVLAREEEKNNDTEAGTTTP